MAEHDGRIYLDLADEFWRCVEIGPRGWRIADDVPVRFRRPAGMLPLPLPARGGSIEELRQFLNLPNGDDFVLVVAGASRCGRTERSPPKPTSHDTGALLWLMGLRPVGSYPHIRSWRLRASTRNAG